MILPRLVYMLEKAEARYSDLGAGLCREAEIVYREDAEVSLFWKHAQLVSAEVSTWPQWKRGGSAVPK